MDRNQAKRLLPIIKAFAEGKAIQLETVDKGWQDIHSASFGSNPKNYRIKPEPKHRPFKNGEECWQEMQKHQPFGWVKNIEFEKYFLIDEVTSIFSDAQIHISAYEHKNWNNFSTVFHNNTFADGTPFGVKIEEDYNGIK